MFRTMLEDIWASRSLSWRLFLRDLSAMYRQSILGYVWAFIPPLVASLPFVFLNSQGVVSIKGTDIPYAAFAMTGTIIWQVFTDALSSPLKTVLGSKSVITRINCPREAFALAGVGMVIFNCIIRMILLAAVFLWFHIVPPVSAPLFILGVSVLMSIGFMIGIALTPVGLLFSDIQQMIPLFSTFLMFMTPVLYPMPESGTAALLARWNPLTCVVVTTRDWLTTGNPLMLGQFYVVAGVTALLLLVVWVFYRLALPHVIARIGN